MRNVECVIVGAGVMGSAVARSLLLNKKVSSVMIIEKEPAPAKHTSGRNSGVVHAGFNLKPGSVKAKFCVEGNARMKEFCLSRQLPYQPVGTLVVALDQNEMPVLEEIHRRGVANGVPGIRLIDAKELKEKEPNALGFAALYAPSGAIASGKAVTEALVTEAEELGCQVYFDEKLLGIEPVADGFKLRTSSDEITTRYLVNCGGLYADEVAHLMGVGTAYTIVPFRGEYLKIKAVKKDLVRSMLYPVPDLNYPFLGVHWTKMVSGDLMIGPNASMAFGRESYSAWAVNWKEVGKMLWKKNFWNLFRSKDFRRLAKSQLAMSYNPERFVREAQKLVAGVELNDFEPGKNGNRAQLVDAEGRLVDDIMVKKEGNSLHVLNAVSPGFTCSLPFADHLVDTLLN